MWEPLLPIIYPLVWSLTKQTSLNPLEGFPFFLSFREIITRIQPCKHASSSLAEPVLCYILEFRQNRLLWDGSKFTDCPDSNTIHTGGPGKQLVALFIFNERTNSSCLEIKTTTGSSRGTSWWGRTCYVSW